jgi:DNA-directed RNA polymerase subunit K/omega
LENFGNIDSKYRFIILASKRAKQLLKGAKPKIKAKSRNLIRIAQTEVRSGLIEYEIIPARPDIIPEQEERIFVGAGIGGDDLVEADVITGKDVVEEESGKEAAEVVDEDDGDADEVEEDAEDALKEDKDE